jgi:hypothetical protein
VLPRQAVHTRRILARFAAVEADHREARPQEGLAKPLDGDDRRGLPGHVAVGRVEQRVRHVGWIGRRAQGGQRAAPEKSRIGQGIPPQHRPALRAQPVDAERPGSARHAKPPGLAVAIRVPTALVRQVAQDDQAPARRMEGHHPREGRFAKRPVHIGQHEDVGLLPVKARQGHGVDHSHVMPRHGQCGGGVGRPVGRHGAEGWIVEDRDSHHRTAITVAGLPTFGSTAPM